MKVFMLPPARLKHIIPACLLWKWVHWNGEGKYTGEVQVTNKEPLSWSSLWPFSSLPSCIWNPCAAPFLTKVKDRLLKPKDQQCTSTSLKKGPIIFSLNCSCNSDSRHCLLRSECNAAHQSCLCVLHWVLFRIKCSKSRHWVRSGHPEGITNRWLLVLLIPYTVKQAFLENSHSNMSILSRWELESRVVQPSDPPSTPHPKSHHCSPPPSHRSSRLPWNSG